MRKKRITRYGKIVLISGIVIGIAIFLFFINFDVFKDSGIDLKNVSSDGNQSVSGNQSGNQEGNQSGGNWTTGGGGSGSSGGGDCTPICTGKICGEDDGCGGECWQDGCEDNVEKEKWGNYLFHSGIMEIVPLTVRTFNDRLEYDMELMDKIGVDVISPSAGRIHSINKLDHEWWWREWVDTYDGLITPWKLLWDDNPYEWPIYGESNPGSYSSQERFDTMKLRLQQIVNASEGNVAEYKGRAILNWGKENTYTYNYKWPAGLFPEDAEKFVDYIENEFNDSSPGIDSNNDGKTFNSVSRENYNSWDEFRQDRFYMFVKNACNRSDCVPNNDPRNYYEHPYLFFRYVHWVEDMIIGDYYNDLAEDVNVWRLINYVPFRHKDELAFLLADHLFRRSVSSTDYWTRKDSDKFAFIAGVSQGSGYYKYNEVLHSKYFRDIEFANLFGSVSRIGGYYLYGFDMSGKFYWPELFSDWKRHPNYVRNLKWWSDFFEEQNWILDDMLTEEPKIAILYKDLELSALESKNTTIREPIIPPSYSKHYIDWEAILNNELNNYEYFILTSSRLPENVLDKIVEFKNNGGTVIGIFGGGMFNLFGERTDHFEELFEVVPDKYLINRYFRGSSPDWRYEFDTNDSFYKMFSVDSQIDGRYTLDGVSGIHGDLYISVIPQGNSEAIGTIYRTGDIVSTITEDGRGIYHGVKLTWDLDLHMIPKLFEIVEVERGLVAKNSNGDEIISYIKENQKYDSYMAVLVNEFDDSEVELEFKELNGYDVWDIRKENKVGVIENDLMSLSIETEEPVILLISKNNDLIDKFMEVQSKVNQDAEDLFPFDGGNMIFFIKADLSSYNPYLGRDLDVEPNAVIVVGEDVSQKGIDFANTLQELFYSWNNGNQRILLDILNPDDVSDSILDGKNIVLIGGPNENSLSARLINEDYRLDESIGISGRQRNGWYEGGNVNMILDDENYYKEFYNFIRINAGHNDISKSGISAPWDGYKLDLLEIDKNWGWEYSRGWNGVPERSDDDIWRTENNMLIVNASNDYNRYAYFTTFSSLNNVNWYDMNYSVEVKLQDGDSKFGIGIGEYLFVINETNWSIVNFESVYADPVVLESGALFGGDITEFNDLYVVLEDGVFKAYINDDLIVSRDVGVDRNERHPNYYAKNGNVWIRDIEVHTRDYDKVPEVLLSPFLETENIFLRMWNWFKGLFG